MPSGKPPAKLIEHTCKYCGKIYYRKEFELKKGPSYWCSYKCKGYSLRKNNRYKKISVPDPTPEQEGTVYEEELYRTISVKTNVTEFNVKRVIESLFQNVRLYIMDDKKVSIPKFVTFIPMSVKPISVGNENKMLKQNEIYYLKADFNKDYVKHIFSKHSTVYISEKVETLIGERLLNENNMKEAIEAINHKFTVTKQVKKEVLGLRRGGTAGMGKGGAAAKRILKEALEKREKELLEKREKPEE